MEYSWRIRQAIYPPTHQGIKDSHIAPSALHSDIYARQVDTGQVHRELDVGHPCGVSVNNTGHERGSSMGFGAQVKGSPVGDTPYLNSIQGH